MRFLYVKEKVVKLLICDINKIIVKGLGDICLANISSSVLIRKMYPSKFLYLLFSFFLEIFLYLVTVCSAFIYHWCLSSCIER